MCCILVSKSAIIIFIEPEPISIVYHLNTQKCGLVAAKNVLNFISKLIFIILTKKINSKLNFL